MQRSVLFPDQITHLIVQLMTIALAVLIWWLVAIPVAV